MPSVNELIAYDAAHTRWGGTAAQEKRCLYGIILNARPHRVIEIGVRGGHATAWIALALEDAGRGHVVGVDKWASPNSPYELCYPAAVERLEDLRLEHRVTLVRMDSIKFLRTQANGSAEIVIVDGGHSYRQALADIRQAVRVASRLIIVHDATNITDVNRACKDVGGGTWLYGTPPTESRGYWIRNVGPAPGIEHRKSEGGDR